jgi:hypothetical protein
MVPERFLLPPVDCLRDVVLLAIGSFSITKIFLVMEFM